MIKTILSPFDHYPLQLELGEDFLPSQNPNLKLKQNHSRPQHPNHSYLNLHPPHLNQSTEVRQVVSYIRELLLLGVEIKIVVFKATFYFIREESW